VLREIGQPTEQRNVRRKQVHQTMWTAFYSIFNFASALLVRRISKTFALINSRFTGRQGRCHPSPSSQLQRKEESWFNIPVLNGMSLITIPQLCGLFRLLFSVFQKMWTKKIFSELTCRTPECSLSEKWQFSFLQRHLKHFLDGQTWRKIPRATIRLTDVIFLSKRKADASRILAVTYNSHGYLGIAHDRKHKKLWAGIHGPFRFYRTEKFEASVSCMRISDWPNFTSLPFGFANFKIFSIKLFSKRVFYFFHGQNGAKDPSQG